MGSAQTSTVKRDVASDAAQAVQQGAKEADDYVRKFVERVPKTAIGALVLGWVIGHMGRSRLLTLPLSFGFAERIEAVLQLRD
jgi:hypothetical protein